MAWNVYIMGEAETPEDETAALEFARTIDLSQFPGVSVASFSGSLLGGTTFYESPAQAATTETDATVSAGTPEPQEVASLNSDVDEQPETPTTE